MDLHRAGEEARALGQPNGPIILLDLAVAVIEAYPHLHAQGVLHGDVHPRNLVVDAAGEVRIIDFGLAVHRENSTAVQGLRGGVDFFLDPETAAARLAAQPVPAPSIATEQYSIGALIYMLLTGAHTHAFSLDETEMLPQLRDLPPRAFREHGAPAMPSVERVIARTLAKSSDTRYRSLTTLLEAFRAAAGRDRARLSRRAAQSSGVAPLSTNVFERLSMSGELFTGELVPPTASVMYGAAGIAYALLRLAEVKADAELLALAELWGMRATDAIGTTAAFLHPAQGTDPQIFGTGSFYHNVAGVYAVAGFVAHAGDDAERSDWATNLFTAVVDESTGSNDVLFGRAGQLIGCSLALERLPRGRGADQVRSAGQRLHDLMDEELQLAPALAECPEQVSLGAAHGWAGYLYALLLWSTVSQRKPPYPASCPGWTSSPRLVSPVGGQCTGRTGWARRSAGGPIAASWCNGAAGHVFLWTLAHQVFGMQRYLRLAQEAAWGAFQQQTPALNDLCCGLGGRAYALLCLYRHTGHAAWLARARRLGELAVQRIGTTTLRRHSLYKGEVGVALLAADLLAPQHARMPLFEVEGWPRPAGRRDQFD